MEWLNYHHLLYFWTTAREGSLARAAAQLHLTKPTISAQIRDLERALGGPLFLRNGRGLELTDSGHLVKRYAEEIFGLGKELLDTVRGRPTGRPLRLVVGVADIVPKLVAFRLLEPALRLPEKVRLEVREDHHDRLLQQLAGHALDVVITDAPVGPGVRIKAFSHLLGESELLIMGARRLAATARRRFPSSLQGLPMLLPSPLSAQRRALDQWFEEIGVQPEVVAECDDTALLKVMAEQELGLVAIPATVEAEVKRQHRLVTCGRIDEVRMRYYAISIERRIRHPAVLALTTAARRTLVS